MSKDCTKPIISYGIILIKVVRCRADEANDVPDLIQNTILRYSYTDNNYPKLKFLLVQRRNTMSFIDFMRGKYPSEEPQKTKALEVQFSEMTHHERTLLSKSTFDELWQYLWVDRSCKIYKNERARARQAFHQIDVKSQLRKSKGRWSHPEFGFPKGRRNFNEKNVRCAERELYEETGYTRKMYDYMSIEPFEESFIGSDGIAYRHKYFVALLKPDYVRAKIDFGETNGEIGCVGWFTEQECKRLIREYDTAKLDLLNRLVSRLKDLGIHCNN